MRPELLRQSEGRAPSSLPLLLRGQRGSAASSGHVRFHLTPNLTGALACGRGDRRADPNRSHAMAAVYDTIGRGYAVTRQPDPRIARAIREALGEVGTVLNVGA